MAILKWVGLDGIDWLCSRQLLKFKCYPLADEGWKILDAVLFLMEMRH